MGVVRIRNSSTAGILHVIGMIGVHYVHLEVSVRSAGPLVNCTLLWMELFPQFSFNEWSYFHSVHS